ncbi:MAG TPA: hypothetical protein VE130_14240 [Nitrososphaeraceae archaeon]|nr:hypothetical protein [Nitrososphaeraceae archaeon]
MTKWITDTSLEELDQDIEELIRSILYNHLHKTIKENSLAIGGDTKSLLLFYSLQSEIVNLLSSLSPRGPYNH